MTTFWLDCRYSCRDCPALMMTGRNLTNDGQPDVGCRLVALVVSGAGVQQGVLLLHTPIQSADSQVIVYILYTSINHVVPILSTGAKTFQNQPSHPVGQHKTAQSFVPFLRTTDSYPHRKSVFVIVFRIVDPTVFWKDPDPSKRPDPTVYSKLTVVPDEKRAIAERCGPWTLNITTDLR